MSRTLQVQFDSSLQWNWQDTGADGSVLRDNLQPANAGEWADGSGASQANLLWHDQRTLTASSSETLDLTALTRTIFNSVNTVNLGHVKGIYIENLNEVSGDDLTVGKAASAQFAGPLSAGTVTQIVKAGGILYWPDAYGTGWATSGANNLKIANGSGHTINYRIVIWGN